MSRAKIAVAAVMLAGAAVVIGHAPAIAAGARDGQAPPVGILQALHGSELSNGELAEARGGQDIAITNVKNTTTTALNVGAASSGTVNGGAVQGGLTGAAAGSIVDSQGIISQFSNTGSNVMLNSSVAIFINAQ